MLFAFDLKGILRLFQDRMNHSLNLRILFLKLKYFYHYAPPHRVEISVQKQLLYLLIYEYQLVNKNSCNDLLNTFILYVIFTISKNLA